MHLSVPESLKIDNVAYARLSKVVECYPDPTWQMAHNKPWLHRLAYNKMRFHESKSSLPFRTSPMQKAFIDACGRYLLDMKEQLDFEKNEVSDIGMFISLIFMLFASVPLSFLILLIEMNL